MLKAIKVYLGMVMSILAFCVFIFCCGLVIEVVVNFVFNVPNTLYLSFINTDTVGYIFGWLNSNNINIKVEDINYNLGVFIICMLSVFVCEILFTISIKILKNVSENDINNS